MQSKLEFIREKVEQTVGDITNDYQPITLADVLRTIEESFQKKKGFIGVDVGGGFLDLHDRRYFRDRKNQIVFWDLTKDLDSQSEDTIKFLSEILK